MMERFELTLNNEPGALARVISVVTGRRWRLGSLWLPPAESPDRRPLTLELDSGGRDDQVLAQFGKLYDVLAVRRLPPA